MFRGSFVQALLRMLTQWYAAMLEILYGSSERHPATSHIGSGLVSRLLYYNFPT